MSSSSTLPAPHTGKAWLFLGVLAWSIGLCAPLWRTALTGGLYVDLAVCLQLLPLPLGMLTLPTLFRAQRELAALEHWGRRARRRLRWACRAAFLAVGLVLLYAVVAFVPWIALLLNPLLAIERVGIPTVGVIWIFWLRRRLEQAELRSPRFFDEEWLAAPDTERSVNSRLDK
ncbi:MAG: hypothetical protein ACKO6N_04405 [Myxococcota bacterium]